MTRCDLRLGRRRGTAVRGTLVIVVGHVEAKLEKTSVNRSHPTYCRRAAAASTTEASRGRRPATATKAIRDATYLVGRESGDWRRGERGLASE